MKTETEFTFNKDQKEYIIQLKNKCKCWLLLIPMFLSIIYIIIVLAIMYL